MSSWARVSTTTGYIGIGTGADPTSAISVYTSSSSSSNQLYITSTSNFANIRFNNNNTAATFIGLGCTNITGNYSNNMFIQTDKSIIFNTGTNTSTTTVPTMIILRSGNIGIGSSIPNTKLDISGVVNITNGANAVPSFSTAYGGTGDRIIFRNGTAGSVYPYSVGVNTSALWHSIPLNNSHDFYVDGSNIAQITRAGLVINENCSITCRNLIATVTTTNNVTNTITNTITGDIQAANITTTGNIGVGKTNPATAIDINGIINVSNVNGTLAAPSFSTIYGGLGDRIILKTGVVSTTYPYSIGLNTNELWFSVPTSGIYNWYVNGVAYMTLNTLGALTVYDDIICFSNASDIKLKENIKPFDFNCIDLINKINPVEFTWKDINEVPENKRLKKDYGFIAQEIELLFPHIVCDTKSYKTIKYEKLVPYLVQAIKELNAKINKKND